MISFIIPTLQKSEVLIELLCGLNEQKYTSEIILINNALTELPFKKKFNKLKILTPNQNLYVNPSWNIGVNLAKENKIALCNDDILFDFSKLGLIQEFISPKIGIIGMADSNFSQIDYHHIKLRKTISRCFGFGTLMFLNRINYRAIPEDLKIWHGDDYLFNAQNKINYLLEGFPIKTKMSSTSGLPIFNNIIEQDTLNFNLNYVPKINLSKRVINKIKYFFK